MPTTLHSALCRSVVRFSYPESRSRPEGSSGVLFYAVRRALRVLPKAKHIRSARRTKENSTPELARRPAAKAKRFTAYPISPIEISIMLSAEAATKAKKRQTPRSPSREHRYPCSYEPIDEEAQKSKVPPAHPLAPEQEKPGGETRPHPAPRMDAAAQGPEIQKKAQIPPASLPHGRGDKRIRPRDRHEQQHRGQTHPENALLETGHKPERHPPAQTGQTLLRSAKAPEQRPLPAEALHGRKPHPHDPPHPEIRKQSPHTLLDDSPSATRPNPAPAPQTLRPPRRPGKTLNSPARRSPSGRGRESRPARRAPKRLPQGHAPLRPRRRPPVKRAPPAPRWNPLHQCAAPFLDN